MTHDRAHVSVISFDDETRLVLTGEFDISTREILEAAIARACASGRRRLVVDLVGVGFISAHSLARLIQAGACFAGRVRIATVDPMVRRMVEIIEPSASSRVLAAS